MIEFLYPFLYLPYGPLFLGRLVDGAGLGMVFAW